MICHAVLFLCLDTLCYAALCLCAWPPGFFEGNDKIVYQLDVEPRLLRCSPIEEIWSEI